MKVYGIIYKVTNKLNGKVYIGQTTKSISIRRSEHYSCSRDYHFHKAIRKYNKSDFIWEEIDTAKTKEELDNKEIYYISLYNTYKEGYNMTFGGSTRKGYRCSEDTKELIRHTKIGNTNMLGKRHTKESKNKMSEAVKGNKHNRYGKFGSDNPAAKTYIVTTPEGKNLIIKGIAQFCRDNNLYVSNLSACAKGKRKSHKGYKCKYYEELT